jgi:hypothetical protein
MGGFFAHGPRWLYLDVLVPFPCEVAVIGGAYALTKVPGDSFAARRALEEAGKGWWSMEYVLTRPDGTIDPTKPTRITEARIVVRPSQSDWDRGWVFVAVGCHSLNTYCYTSATPARTDVQGTLVAFLLKKSAATAPPATPKVTVPDVVGQRLDLALSTLWGAKFKVNVVGPVDVSTNLRVVSQSLAAGSTVDEGSGILVSTQEIAAAPGAKSLSITNQSNRAASLDIWLFDHSTGSWSKETTIAYQATGDVSFGDGHMYSVAAVDDTTPLCKSGRPDEVSCVYATPGKTFDGDDNGIALTWTVT